MEELSYTSTTPMGRTACIEPQCLNKGDLYLYLKKDGYNEITDNSDVHVCV